ncbi:hypothetical protein LMG28688_05868 [Paraburkholderia caffeinitolerans]|uniref:Uncharacterized protein n=1 Tax=Paraburkholderia caffeinitolerans TaxID=1723730 RepID=A0A6J5GMV0_9BURK|nr:hypothetical protein LMG28688_05868 [Paraburkholderia caffeinitolerans]
MSLGSVPDFTWPVLEWLPSGGMASAMATHWDGI